jgi:UDP-N-acetylmuramyl tripeptide synthase
MTDDVDEKIEKLLQEAAECDMLGGLAASHEERIAFRQRAEELRELAAKAQVLVEQSEARLAGKSPQRFMPI